MNKIYGKRKGFIILPGVFALIACTVMLMYSYHWSSYMHSQEALLYRPGPVIGDVTDRSKYSHLSKWECWLLENDNETWVTVASPLLGSIVGGCIVIYGKMRLRRHGVRTT